MTNCIDLEARLTAYLALRRALGVKMDRDARVLEDFVRFTQDRGSIEVITSRMVFEWLDARKAAEQSCSRESAQSCKAVPAVSELSFPGHAGSGASRARNIQTTYTISVHVRGDRGIAEVCCGIRTRPILLSRSSHGSRPVGGHWLARFGSTRSRQVRCHASEQP